MLYPLSYRRLHFILLVQITIQPRGQTLASLDCACPEACIPQERNPPLPYGLVKREKLCKNLDCICQTLLGEVTSRGTLSWPAQSGAVFPTAVNGNPSCCFRRGRGRKPGSPMKDVGDDGKRGFQDATDFFSLRSDRV